MAYPSHPIALFRGHGPNRAAIRNPARANAADIVTYGHSFVPRSHSPSNWATKRWDTAWRSLQHTNPRRSIQSFLTVLANTNNEVLATFPDRNSACVIFDNQYDACLWIQDLITTQPWFFRGTDRFIPTPSVTPPFLIYHHGVLTHSSPSPTTISTYGKHVARGTPLITRAAAQAINIHATPWIITTNTPETKDLATTILQQRGRNINIIFANGALAAIRTQSPLAAIAWVTAHLRKNLGTKFTTTPDFQAAPKAALHELQRTRSQP